MILQFSTNFSTKTLIHFVFTFLNVTYVKSLIYSTSGEIVRLKVAGVGKYNKEPAVFLFELNESLKPRSEVLPIPIDTNAQNLLTSALTQTEKTKAQLLKACQMISNRDGSFYDNLPYQWGNDFSKRNIFNKLLGKDWPQKFEETISPFEIVEGCVEEELNASIKGLVIENEDSQNDSVCLGGTVIIEKLPEYVQILGEKIPKPFSGGDTFAVESTCDEAIGFAITKNQPILMDKSLYESATVLVNYVFKGNRMKLDIDMAGEKSLTSFAPSISLADVKTAEKYLKLSGAEKKFLLRKSGIKPPRRRVSDNDALDALLLPMVDEYVRREVLIEKAFEKDDYDTAFQLKGKMSKRGLVKEGIKRAIEKNQLALAAKLQIKYEMLTAIRADVTQDEGMYDQYLDADEWYLEQRRKSMGQ
mmetsp:Transcript_10470/g.15685  ORF Transcript_10470/g.15685 Transcript_10470/m.15685 type:complete len:417 (-) Transcript_10470:86-1336(-)|eukprot:CAMPEP_0171456510 /NCGR_PEP_ID=MMETSP0945-20130129/2964_1 /TAXON_ID=109269 /ORGANISM="Vaucheria litorea, Strain CCMP2940" /LENGTH=416 /DNA_ID=CAMNT_0011981941 /DNA_START=71 /DNA_END=1321 /DNA_ORIENTATION=-